MSTQIVNNAGTTVAIKYCGGKARGLCLDVMLPRNLMKDVGDMTVSESTSLQHTNTLAGYIAEMQARDATISFREPGVHGPLSKVGFFNRA